MRKAFLIIFGILLLLGLIFAIGFILQTNSKETTAFKTETAIRKDLDKKSVATGKIIPKEEIEIKPNISGIVDRIMVEEGDRVVTGQLIASVKVVPDINSLNNASQEINARKIVLENERRQFNRQRQLYTQGVISKQEYENSETSYKSAQQNLRAAEKNYTLIKTGVAPGLENVANTQIRSTINGMVLEIPIKEGNQVIEANQFNAGTTIAFVADVAVMIFEGKVDEADAGKLKEGMDLEITVGAIPSKKFKAKLTHISPKGIEENGSVRFNIKADVTVPDDVFIRAGYSANAEFILDRRKDVLLIREALVQYDNKDQAFVEVQQADGSFKRKDLTLGTSDGVYIEVVKGINEKDKIKIWNESDEDAEKK